MKKIYLMMFVFSAALTHISCGSGSGLRSANLTPAQQQRILDTLQTSIGSADSSANMDPSSTPTGSLSCDQGVENFSVSATSGSVTDVNCVNFEGGSYNATTDLVVNGNVSYQASSSQVVFTYNNVSARRDTRSCTLSGTMSMSAPQSATSSISLQMSLNSLCGATSIRESGNVTFSTSGGHDYANGIMTFDVGSGAYDCQISNLDLNTVSCAILAQSCRFPATLCGVTVAADSSSGSGGNTDVPFSFSQSPGIGGGGSGGSYQFPNLINATQSQGTYCMTHEKLIGMWTESTSYNSPYIRFEPMRLFLC
ncbi:MAG: hypothetical protein IPJ69_00350 [Deltaproteobacteria bacterium]|nr:MAG: hypothetical protein IPJ69_00350 [Deltaproteobacteria bacterium]